MKQKEALAHLISVKELNQEMIGVLLKKAHAIKTGQEAPRLPGKLMASCFFEPSTRTRLSFEAAILRLGGQTLGFSSEQGTSMEKGESFADTIRIISSYVDLLVVRHPREGAARLAAQYSRVPVINAGDGANQHPTQTLTDLFSLTECFPSWMEEGIEIGIAGDLKYSRTVHSLLEALVLYPKVRLTFLASAHLTLPEEYTDLLKRRGVRFTFASNFHELLAKIDVLYMTRCQQERQSCANHGVVPYLSLDASLLKIARAHLKIFHPLPRVGEIDKEVDASPMAYYFQQAQNGVWVRQALLVALLEGNKSLYA